MVVESLSRLKINSDRLLHYSQVHFKNALMSFVDEKKMRCKICHEINKGGKKKFFSIGRLLLHVGTQHNKIKELLPNEEKHLLQKGRVFKERGYNVTQKDIDPICEEKTDEDLFCKFCVGVYTNTKYQLYRHYSGKKVNSGLSPHIISTQSTFDPKINQLIHFLQESTTRLTYRGLLVKNKHVQFVKMEGAGETLLDI